MTKESDPYAPELAYIRKNSAMQATQFSEKATAAKQIEYNPPEIRDFSANTTQRMSAWIRLRPKLVLLGASLGLMVACLACGEPNNSTIPIVEQTPPCKSDLVSKIIETQNFELDQILKRFYPADESTLDMRRSAINDNIVVFYVEEGRGYYSGLGTRISKNYVITAAHLAAPMAGFVHNFDDQRIVYTNQDGLLPAKVVARGNRSYYVDRVVASGKGDSGKDIALIHLVGSDTSDTPSEG